MNSFIINSKLSNLVKSITPTTHWPTTSVISGNTVYSPECEDILQKQTIAIEAGLLVNGSKAPVLV